MPFIDINRDEIEDKISTQNHLPRRKIGNLYECDGKIYIEMESTKVVELIPGKIEKQMKSILAKTILKK